MTYGAVVVAVVVLSLALGAVVALVVSDVLVPGAVVEGADVDGEVDAGAIVVEEEPVVVVPEVVPSVVLLPSD